MANRIDADKGSGFRANPADFGSSASSAERGSFNSEQNPYGDQSQNMLSSQMAGNPHSSHGFRRALMKTQRSSGTLKDQLPDKVTFGGKGFKKPNYFAQGGKRHGLHVSSGAPHTAGGRQEGTGNE